MEGEREGGGWREREREKEVIYLQVASVRPNDSIAPHVRPAPEDSVPSSALVFMSVLFFYSFPSSILSSPLFLRKHTNRTNRDRCLL